MTFDAEVLYTTIVEEALAAMGLRIDYWEAEEIAENTLRRLEEIEYERKKTNRTL
jgi:hypothetical protein